MIARRVAVAVSATSRVMTVTIVTIVTITAIVAIVAIVTNHPKTVRSTPSARCRKAMRRVIIRAAVPGADSAGRPRGPRIVRR